MNKQVAAHIGIAGAFTMAVSDIILLGQPVSGSEYGISSIGAMEQVDSMRAAIGSIEGLLASFFICFGFWYLKCLFDEVNKTLSMWLFVSLSSMMFFGGAFHAAYYFLAIPGLDAGGLNLIPEVVLNNFKNHLELLSYLGIPGFVMGTFLFFKLASDKRFPVWYRFCNPLVLNLIFLGAFYFLPAPFGGYLKPIFVNLATLTLFTVSLRVGKSV